MRFSWSEAGKDKEKTHIYSFFGEHGECGELLCAHGVCVHQAPFELW